ncbi:MAG: acyl-CoA dehydratase activase [Planctomycetota bacterium]|jgi:predicted CoA-substrate-specific enzyme activase
MSYSCGVDIGASATKLVILDEERRAVGKCIRSSGVDYAATAAGCLEEALETGSLKREDVLGACATGYGRDNVPWATRTMTEIACHGRGAHHHFPRAVTVIDIGAQDNKVIHLDDSGRRLGFKMNRKCAAGTGAFLEEIALRLSLPVSDLNGLAERSTKEVTLGSFCTVFTATEILAKIRAGEKVEDIVKGAFRSVVKRVFEMEAVDGPMVLTGGVIAHNPLLAELIEESFGNEVFVPPEPQYVGALGAALIALENSDKGE